jgi:hypothetical protein
MMPKNYSGKCRELQVNGSLKLFGAVSLERM